MAEPLFPVYNYMEGTELPTSGIFYVVASNGLFLHKETGYFSGFVKVKNISVLDDLTTQEWVKCDLPRKVPGTLVYKIWKLFHDVVEAYKAESCILLYFLPETQEYRMVIPEQFVSHGRVKYTRPSISHEQDWVPIGTIHSHCDFEAFHSGTDEYDEESFDGLHVTFGHNDKEIISVVASVVLNGKRDKIDPQTVLDGLEHVDGEFYKLTEIVEMTESELNGWKDLIQPFPASKLKRFQFAPEPFFNSPDFRTGDA